MVNLNRNNSNWSFEERRKINENWDILESAANSSANGNNGLKSEVDQLKANISENTIRTTEALQKSNQALAGNSTTLDIANDAKATAENSLRSVTQIEIRVDDANLNADFAVRRSEVADAKSDNSLALAEDSNNRSQNVQRQLNEIIADAGQNSPEVVASRTDSITGENFVSLSERLDEQHKSLTDDLGYLNRAIKPYQYNDFGIAFDSNASDLVVRNKHASWSHGCVDYDKEEDSVIVFYDLKPSHILTGNRVLMRKKNNNGLIGQPIVVADKISQNISCKTQGSGIAKNGDYLSLVYEFSGTNEGLNIYRSSNKGLNWTSQRVLIGGSSVSAFNGDITGFLVLRSGRILSLVKQSETSSRIIYSDDNGVNWNFSNTQLNGATEPAWCELSDGTIVCYLRENVDSRYNEKIPAKFTTSANSGIDWTQPVNSKTITNLTNSNGHLIYHDNTKSVEFIHHSRFTELDGYSSIFVSVATEENIKKDEMGPQVRISKLAPHNRILSNGERGDSGYIGAVKDTSGVIHAFYYNGTFQNAQICYLEGKQTKDSNAFIELDYNTGQKLNNTTNIFPKAISKWEIGGLSGIIGQQSAIVPAENRLRLRERIEVKPGESYEFFVTNNEYLVTAQVYTENNILIYNTGFLEKNNFKIPENGIGMKFLVRKKDDSIISAYEVSKDLVDLRMVISNNYLLSGKIVLNQGEDFNSLLTSGSYVSRTTANTESFTNKPNFLVGAFSMIVEEVADVGFVRRTVKLNDAFGSTYTQSVRGNVFGVWQREQRVYNGSGSPNGSVSGLPGDIYINTEVNAVNLTYIKATGTSDTGWRALTLN